MDDNRTWSTAELILASALAAFATGATVSFAMNSMGGPEPSSDYGFASWGGPGGSGGGGGSLPPLKETAYKLVSKRLESDEEEDAALQARSESGTSFDVSVQADQGGRMYMEDEYFVGHNGKFVGVFDGHGGSDVSRYLRHHLYQIFKREWKRTSWEMDNSSLHSLIMAMRAAFEAIEEEILGKEEMQYQGSTAVVVAIHEEPGGSKIAVSANVGDSRAVLCRSGSALDLTRDHKPGDDRERARIESMGEHIEWDNLSKVHRVRNLSLSRAIGDRFAKPVVSGVAEIQRIPLTDDDEFIILASDGLWDVMDSEELVQFVKRKMEAMKNSGSQPSSAEGRKIERRMKEVRRKNMSHKIVQEALRRGSVDNICVVVVWLKPLSES